MTDFWSCSPVAVPEKIFGLTLNLDFFDRCHSLPSLHLPPAALGLLPRFELATRLHEIRDFMEASRPRIEILSAYADRADEVAGSIGETQKNSHPDWDD